MARKMKTMDGNTAAAHASYAFTEVATIFPITPSSPMAELVDEWAAHGKKNIFGQPVKVVEMQSEGGAAGAFHGSLQAGALTTTYTASQGLLLMIPNMYKIAGELLPGVFQVSARALATHALSIFGDHQDVMATRQTGFALLSSANVQEALDLGFIAHLSALKASLPFLHFFDGFRTSHEIQKIEVLDYEDLAPLIDWQAIETFRSRGLNPEHPVLRGTAQNPDIYFQGREASNRFYEAVPDLVEHYMREYQKLTGREYHPFTYYGAPDAERIIVAMGSVCDAAEEVVDHLRAGGEKVGVLKVHLYRPFSAKYFFNVLPKSVKKIAVLDRTKEPGSLGEPLYLDVVNVFYNWETKPVIVGGRYGLGSKDTTPAQLFAVYKNLAANEPKNNFTIGIIDDVTYASLPLAEATDTTPDGTISCKFWGLGSDGTVGANKSAIKIIGDNTDLYAQGYFEYDSKKSGGVTISHLRFGREKIKSSYLVSDAHYVACHNKAFLGQYDLLAGLKKNGTFVLNCNWTPAELEENLPASVKRYIAANGIKFYTIDAISIASRIGLGGRINMIMQAAFFKLSSVIPVEDAVKYLKESIVKTYGKKGQNIVEMNWKAVDEGIEALVKVDVPAAWAGAAEEAAATVETELPAFIRDVHNKMERHEGDALPVSAFSGREDGTFPMGTAAYEKRGIAVLVPEWDVEKCIQCTQCSYVCPHAAIRPFLLNQEEQKRAPQAFVTKKALGKALEGMEYRVQVSPLDCTGCGNCADVCPAKGKALVMKPAEELSAREAANWEFAMTLSEKHNIMDPKTLKGSQFNKPLLEFNGACPGCGETAYVKLLTQLFGDRLMIANATGCSSIWGGSAPSIPYTTNAKGQGPTWANSLFEDNAEFGYGMYLGVSQARLQLAELVKKAMAQGVSQQLASACQEWLDNFDEGEGSKAASAKLLAALTADGKPQDPLFQQIMAKKDHLVKKSQWIVGGDGWAYDIGYGGLDHVLASGDDVNILVVDTEVYSNTGGQSSKATPTAAIAKFAASGKKVRKKDLGMISMSYGYIYVAQISLGANMNQALKAITEAEAHKGPSIVIAYAPCINHGIKAGMSKSVAEGKRAVEAGYWHLYRYNPTLREEGKNPFTLDSKEPTASFKDFILGEIRYASLATIFPEAADQLFEAAAKHAKERYESYKRMTEMKYGE
ncbi:pyruvate-flavodoxin oxidoreductase [Peptococcaceae bacterium CEB3]|nr:pyruvate-flavodoxin oxidoreductase [Peptococcaceae bacterium CEB3]